MSQASFADNGHLSSLSARVNVIIGGLTAGPVEGAPATQHIRQANISMAGGRGPRGGGRTHMKKNGGGGGGGGEKQRAALSLIKMLAAGAAAAAGLEAGMDLDRQMGGGCCMHACMPAAARVGHGEWEHDAAAPPQGGRVCVCIHWRMVVSCSLAVPYSQAPAWIVKCI